MVEGVFVEGLDEQGPFRRATFDRDEGKDVRVEAGAALTFRPWGYGVLLADVSSIDTGDFWWASMMFHRADDWFIAGVSDLHYGALNQHLLTNTPRRFGFTVEFPPGFYSQPYKVKLFNDAKDTWPSSTSVTHKRIDVLGVDGSPASSGGVVVRGPREVLKSIGDEESVPRPRRVVRIDISIE